MYAIAVDFLIPPSVRAFKLRAPSSTGYFCVPDITREGTRPAHSSHATNVPVESSSYYCCSCFRQQQRLRNHRRRTHLLYRKKCLPGLQRPTPTESSRTSSGRGMDFCSNRVCWWEYFALSLAIINEQSMTKCYTIPIDIETTLDNAHRYRRSLIYLWASNKFASWIFDLSRASNKSPRWIFDGVNLLN